MSRLYSIFLLFLLIQFLFNPTMAYASVYGGGNYGAGNYGEGDTTAPSGGSISYTNGYQNTTSVALTVSDGTDSESGIDTSSRLTQRSSATLSGGICGTFSLYSTTTPTGTYPNLTDSTVASGNCYQYQYLVSDNGANQATYTSSSVIKIDTGSPGIPGDPSTTTPTNSSSQSWTWTAATDTISGIANYLWRTTGSAITSGSTNITSAITNLAEGIYNFYIKAVDLAGNIGAEALAGLVTIDQTAPILSSVTSGSLTDTSATISWTSNELSSSKVDYGDSISYGSSSPQSDTSPRVTSHSVILTSLTSCSTYHFRVRSTDASGNETVDTDNSFTTAGCTTTPTSSSTSTSSSSNSSTASVCTDPAPSTKTPWLYGAIAQNSTSITLYFTPADPPITKYVLEYGLTSGNYAYGVQDLSLNSTSQMSYTVNSLAQNTTYFFKIRAQNGCTAGEWSNEISAKTKGLVAFKQLIFTDSALLTTPNDESPPTTPQGSKASLKEPESNPEPTSAPAPLKGYDLKVKVLDTDNRPVEGAEVTIHSTVQTAKTDKAGIATFQNVESGEHRVLITYNDFQGEQSINLTDDVKEFDLNVTIKPVPLSLSRLAYLIISVMGFIILVLIFLLLKKSQHKQSKLA